jgi:hypothetical protein
MRKHCKVENIHLVVCASGEDRCSHAVAVLGQHKLLSKVSVLRPRIHTRTSNDAAFLSAQLGQIKIIEECFAASKVIDCDFLVNLSVLQSLVGSFSGPGALVIDISTMPKRIFFPLIKFVLKKDVLEVPDIFAIYTLPESYPPEHERLSGNLMPMAPLPGFAPSAMRRASRLIVGLGYEMGSLPDFIRSTYPGESDVIAVIPLPPGPPSFQRSLELLRNLEEQIKPKPVDIRRVNSLDLPEAYELVLASAGQEADMAPYGPKPMSLAMCLAAKKLDSAVYYSQPLQYHTDYTVGVASNDGECVHLYPLRVSGKDVY